MGPMARLIAEIRDDVYRTRHLVGKDALDERVLAGFARVPRPTFVPELLREAAYDNRPLPIGHGQTISQPYIVALMTDLLGLEPGERVLEIGTGSGYQTAVLAEMEVEVYTVEVLEKLSHLARTRLEQLGYQEIHYRIGDGYLGWPEEAPYDAVIVTAAAPFLPEALITQLRPDGRMAIPLGQPYAHQTLVQVRKSASGQVTLTEILPVSFVPMVASPTKTKAPASPF
ncbi:L-isoaspartate protein carboxylmethyltransferase type II [Gammaproteobacteria bacterium]